MCIKPDFDRAQNEATNLLLSQDFDSLFIDVRKFRFDKKILIDSVQNFAIRTHRPLSDYTSNEFSGCCVLKNSRCDVILFDDSEKNECRKHWSIVHEVGHIYLNHEKDGEKEEKEAHFFAAQLVAPEIVLASIRKRKGTLHEDELLQYFNISREAATKRLTTLERRPCYNSADIDKQLLQKFLPIINREFPNASAS